MFSNLISLKRLALVAAGLWVAGLWWAPPSAARPPTSVKYSITRAENPEEKKETLILPYAFSAESLPPSCIKKMADNWETQMNIESKPH